MKLRWYSYRDLALEVLKRERLRRCLVRLDHVINDVGNQRHDSIQCHWHRRRNMAEGRKLGAQSDVLLILLGPNHAIRVLLDIRRLLLLLLLLLPHAVAPFLLLLLWSSALHFFFGFSAFSLAFS